MKLILKFDGFFKDFLSGRSARKKFLLIAIVGVMLIMLGSLPAREAKETEPGLEARVASICSSTEGVGDARVMITYSQDGEVYAVAVLCEGADSVTVRERITGLVCSLFGIGAHRISILKISE